MRRAPAALLTAALRPRPHERLVGTKFSSLLTAYVLMPRAWRCGTLQGGTGATVTATPGRPTYVPPPGTRIEVIANYGGSGVIGDYECRWFRWAADQFQAFRPWFCVHGQRPSKDLTAIAATPRGPYLAVIGPRQLREHSRPGMAARERIDVAVLSRPGYLQGISCVIPVNLLAVCLRNVRLLLMTSLPTRKSAAAQDDKILAHIASALRRRIDPRDSP